MSIGETVSPSLRETLADTHIAAVTVAVLLLWTLDGTFRALWGSLSSVAGFLLTAVAIFDIPYFSPVLSRADRLLLFTTLMYLSSAVISFSTAWLLSRWVFGMGPLRSLGAYRARLTRRSHV